MKCECTKVNCKERFVKKPSVCHLQPPKTLSVSSSVMNKSPSVRVRIVEYKLQTSLEPPITTRSGKSMLNEEIHLSKFSLFCPSLQTCSQPRRQHLLPPFLNQPSDSDHPPPPSPSSRRESLSSSPVYRSHPPTPRLLALSAPIGRSGTRAAPDAGIHRQCRRRRVVRRRRCRRALPTRHNCRRSARVDMSAPNDFCNVKPRRRKRQSGQGLRESLPGLPWHRTIHSHGQPALFVRASISIESILSLSLFLSLSLPISPCVSVCVLLRPRLPQPVCAVRRPAAAPSRFPSSLSHCVMLRLAHPIPSAPSRFPSSFRGRRWSPPSVRRPRRRLASPPSCPVASFSSSRSLRRLCGPHHARRCRSWC